MIHFTIEKPHKANFTPSELIYQWSKAHGIPYKITSLFTKYVTINGLDYTYHHWSIQPKDAETDVITVYLALM